MRVFIPSDLQFVALYRGNVTGNLFEEGFVRLNALNHWCIEKVLIERFTVQLLFNNIRGIIDGIARHNESFHNCN